MSDNPLGVPSTEFWNRSISKVWSVDGTGPGPGHTLTPDLQDADGTLWPNPRTDFVLASGGVEVVGDEHDARGCRSGDGSYGFAQRENHR